MFVFFLSSLRIEGVIHPLPSVFKAWSRPDEGKSKSLDAPHCIGFNFVLSVAAGCSILPSQTIWTIVLLFVR